MFVHAILPLIINRKRVSPAVRPARPPGVAKLNFDASVKATDKPLALQAGTNRSPPHENKAEGFTISSLSWCELAFAVIFSLTNHCI
jgi:hypothetical protein